MSDDNPFEVDETIPRTYLSDNLHWCIKELGYAKTETKGTPNHRIGGVRDRLQDMEPTVEDCEDAPPNDELRALIEEWREGYDTYKRATDPETDIRANVLEQCADELEAVIEDE